MKYFSINELSRSTTATTRGINNTPTDVATKNLELLVNKILDPLREAWGNPIYISSGYRSASLNKIVGGAKNSQHLAGKAADISTGSVSGNIKLFNLAKQLQLPFDQLIDEHGYKWIHISYDKDRTRKQVLHL